MRLGVKCACTCAGDGEVFTSVKMRGWSTVWWEKGVEVSVGRVMSIDQKFSATLMSPHVRVAIDESGVPICSDLFFCSI